MSDPVKVCDGSFKAMGMPIEHQFDNSDCWPEAERGDTVVATEDLDPAGANVKAGEVGVVFEESNYYEDGGGPMVRWFSGGACNVYLGQIINQSHDRRVARRAAKDTK